MATAVASAEPAPRRWRRLPDLKGKWLTAYAMLWAMMLAVAVISASRAAYLVLTRPPSWLAYGFSTSQNTLGIHVDSVSSAAVRAAGLQPGDYVVAIDGWKVPRDGALELASARVIKPDGARTIFTIRQAGDGVENISLIRRIWLADQAFHVAGLNRTFIRTYAFLATLLLPALLVPAAILLFARRRREAVPAFLSLSFLMFAAIVNNSPASGISVGIYATFILCAICCLLAALYAFPSGQFERRWIGLSILFALIAVFAPPAISAAMAFALCLLPLAALVSRYRKLDPGPERLQLRWAFLGFAIGLFLVSLSVAVAAATKAWQAQDPRWTEWQSAIQPLLLALGLCAMALGLIIAILRYRLYDADAVIGRSVAYAVLTIGFVALFAAVQQIIQLLGQEYLGQNLGALAGGVAAALAAVAIAPMHDRTRRWAERRFQRGLYRLRHSLPPLVDDLRETAGLEQIAGATLDSLVEGIRTSRAALIADQQLIGAREVSAKEVDGWQGSWNPPSRYGIDRDESDPMFPVRAPLEAEGHGRVGWLLLGPRPDGSMFGKAEFDAIQEITEPVARAVQVVLRRQEREQQFETRLRTVEAAIAKLAKAAGRASVGANFKEGRVL